MYVSYADDDFGEVGPGPFTRDDPDRQHLHVYYDDAPTVPTPVYFFAHGNGGTPAIGGQEAATLRNAGYSVISWESVTYIEGEEDVETCVADADLVFGWAKENALQYNLDMSRVVIGGRSRGSVCSWQLAHSSNPEIKGLYMYNALPDGAWLGDWDPTQDVTESSPPAYLAYGPECPKPITQDCDPNDGHNPRHGQTIVDRYEHLGLGQDITLTDGMHDENGQTPNIMLYFPAFTASTCENTLLELCPDLTPMNCRDCVIDNLGPVGGSLCSYSHVYNFCTSDVPAAGRRLLHRLSGGF